jgi:hypothetical protein
MPVSADAFELHLIWRTSKLEFTLWNIASNIALRRSGQFLDASSFYISKQAAEVPDLT